MGEQSPTLLDLGGALDKVSVSHQWQHAVFDATAGWVSNHEQCIDVRVCPPRTVDAHNSPVRRTVLVDFLMGRYQPNAGFEIFRASPGSRLRSVNVHVVGKGRPLIDEDVGPNGPLEMHIIDRSHQLLQATLPACDLAVPFCDRSLCGLPIIYARAKRTANGQQA